MTTGSNNGPAARFETHADPGGEAVVPGLYRTKNKIHENNAKPIERWGRKVTGPVIALLVQDGRVADGGYR